MTSRDKFFREKIKKIFSDKKSIIDIGGGLRISKKRGNRYDSSHEWILPFLEKVEYKILDPVPDYNPDIVGDIHNLPFADDSQDAILCISVLEHIENPIRACQKIHRVLKPNGYGFIYAPFLYYYHAEKGYYGDYWRFTRDFLAFLFKDFSYMEVQSIRGAVETWFRISSLGKVRILVYFARALDKMFKKTRGKQVSGYYVFLTK
ncbi:methyltransferase domain-containing protein [Patescibacteria group bacterium]|nr:methyltransferase domain-containing protein [Patescibacteria group bacterium]